MELKNCKVLAVDHETTTLDAVCEHLRGSGAVVMRARSAGEALMTVVGTTPDVVLVDVDLKGTDGYGLVRGIRALTQNKGGRVPVVTGAPALLEGDDPQRWRDSGAQAHLTKPYDPQELRAVLKSLAGRQVERRHDDGRLPEHVPTDRRLTAAA